MFHVRCQGNVSFCGRMNEREFGTCIVIIIIRVRCFVQAKQNKKFYAEQKSEIFVPAQVENHHRN